MGDDGATPPTPATTSSASPSSTTSASSGASGPGKTKLARRWVIKMVVGIVICLAFGAWGLYDATVAYPNRGRADAEYKLWRYLDVAPRLTPTSVQVEDPAATLRDLRTRKGSLAAGTPDRAKYEWLDSLAVLGDLGSANERIGENPRERRDFLSVKWESRNPPAALERYDLPLQWLIFGACTLAGLYLILLFLRVASKSFRYDEQHRLTVPGGRTIAPGDLTDVDKTKWHKFMVTLRTEQGQPVTLDLYRYVPLEEWVLEMERIRFPERAAEDERERADGAAPSADPEPEPASAE